MCIDENIKKAIKFASQLLAKREHSKHEIKRKLVLKKIDSSAIDAAIEHLIDIDLLSDKRFGVIYIRSNIDKFGDKKLYYNLSQHNLCQELIDIIVKEEGFDDELTRATNMMEKRFPNGSENSYQSISNFFNYRGFSSHTIHELLKNYTLNEDAY